MQQVSENCGAIGGGVGDSSDGADLGMDIVVSGAETVCDDVKHIVLLGHSYISRLNSFMDADKYQNLGLSTDQFKVTCIGLGGGTLRAGLKCMTQFLHKVMSLHPYIIYLHLGENDISLTSSQISVLLLDFLHRLSSIPDLKFLILSQTLPFPTFSESQKANIIAVNSSSGEALKGMYHFTYWRHHGGFWHAKPGRSPYDRRGVHLNEDGMIKYWHSVKAAVKIAIAKSTYNK